MAGSGFPIDNKEKVWTKSKPYKQWLRKLRATKKVRRSTEEDLCSVKQGICAEDLGIPRKFMPQFTLRNKPFSHKLINEFRRHVKKEYGVKSFKAKRIAKELNPSQNEISRPRVEGLIEDNVIEKTEVPLIVSKNDYIVDGHHRWAAYRMKAPKKPMEVVVIDAPIRDVLGMAIGWGAGHSAF
jgi:hypothetical protein